MVPVGVRTARPPIADAGSGEMYVGSVDDSDSGAGASAGAAVVSMVVAEDEDDDDEERGSADGANTSKWLSPYPMMATRSSVASSCMYGEDESWTTVVVGGEDADADGSGAVAEEGAAEVRAAMGLLTGFGGGEEKSSERAELRCVFRERNAVGERGGGDAMDNHRHEHEGHGRAGKTTLRLALPDATNRHAGAPVRRQRGRMPAIFVEC